jgi:hypothetical protein
VVLRLAQSIWQLCGWGIGVVSVAGPGQGSGRSHRRGGPGVRDYYTRLDRLEAEAKEQT